MYGSTVGSESRVGWECREVNYEKYVQRWQRYYVLRFQIMNTKTVIGFYFVLYYD